MRGLRSELTTLLPEPYRRADEERPLRRHAQSMKAPLADRLDTARVFPVY